MEEHTPGYHSRPLWNLLEMIRELRWYEGGVRGLGNVKRLSWYYQGLSGDTSAVLWVFYDIQDEWWSLRCTLLSDPRSDNGCCPLFTIQCQCLSQALITESIDWWYIVCTTRTHALHSWYTSVRNMCVPCYCQGFLDFVINTYHWTRCSQTQSTQKLF